MSTYVNNLRLEEIGSGERSGTWGDATNTNLELIGEAFGYGTEALSNASTDKWEKNIRTFTSSYCIWLKN